MNISDRVKAELAELKRLRKEIEHIEAQLENERILCDPGLSDLSLNDIDKLSLENQKLLTRIIQLETLLESL